MPNTKSAKKIERKIKRVSIINKARKNRIHTFIVKLKKIIMSGDKELARDTLKKTQPEIHRGVTKGVMKLNRASRIISRLFASVKAMK